MFFFFNDTATTEIYTLSLHDALPILAGLMFLPPWRQDCSSLSRPGSPQTSAQVRMAPAASIAPMASSRSEEHTSELQSRQYLVCRLLLEKKTKQVTNQLNSIKDNSE